MSEEKILGRERAYLGDEYWVEDHADIMARYLFAGPFVTGRRVLDAAIGTGYGAATLGAVGASFVARDRQGRECGQRSHNTLFDSNNFVFG